VQVKSPRGFVEARLDLVVGFAWMDDPRTEASVRELERAVHVLGLRGLKLHSAIQHFSPADRAIVPVIKQADARVG
jgi:predicted TIM-barrel fold metal-dependent hydrolase